MEAIRILPDTLISEIDAAVADAIRKVERDERVTAGVSLTVKVVWNDDYGTPTADVTLKSANGTKRCAVLRNGQLTLGV